MALLVFLTFLTLFTNSYIPVWMLDNERNHMSTVIDQFGEMKGKVDLLSINADMAQKALELGLTPINTELTMYQTIDLGADGIPVFASPTAGLLNYQPYATTSNSTRVEFSYRLSESSTTDYQYDQVGGGVVQFYAPNRYYAQQWVVYENGAIVVRQDDGQIIKAFPSLVLEKSSNFINLSFVQVDFVGKNSNQAGTSNVGLNIDLIYLDAQTFLIDDANQRKVTITFNTMNGEAWNDYLTEYLSSFNDADWDLNYVVGSHTIVLKVYNVYNFSFSKAITQISSEVA
jgi:hypothetical protein